MQYNGVTTEQTVTQRFLPFELLPNFSLSKNVSMGIYYLWARGLEDKDQTRYTHFLSLRTNFNHIKVYRQVFLKIYPQFYYLKLDERDGFFVGSSLTLAMRDFPLSISSTLNKALETNIAVKDFDWNISLVYSFDTEFIKKYQRLKGN